MSAPTVTDTSEADGRAAFAQYETYMKRAQAACDAGKLETAAVFAGVAAHLALRPHAGFYFSKRLERLLADIGKQTSPISDYRRTPEQPIRRVLHVCTEIASVGGLYNMVRHWIDADATRAHSLALTRQRGPVVPLLLESVAKSGGRVHQLNRRMGGQIAWAQELRRLAREHDAVVLHTYSQDVIPLLAFQKAEERSPVLLLNHGDHLFWLGATIADVVINLRDAAQDLSIARRAIEPRRNVMTPTIVAPKSRTHSRKEAKRLLGLAPDSVFLFSAARGMKYRSVDGVSFADPHVDVLKAHPNAQLWVLGAGDPADWRAASAAVEGRIKALPESPDTALMFEAADIYVDSFPFVSSTSMMEAARLGTPLVSRFYGPKEARIFAINHPGIDRATLHASSEAEYQANLSRLIGDKTLRASMGRAAQDDVLKMHTPPSWMNYLEPAYALAQTLPPVDADAVLASQAEETFSHGEPDRRLYEVFGADHSWTLLAAYAPLLPFADRVAFVAALNRDGIVDARGAARAMVPEWLVRTLKP
ncbi:MAG: hypothetical protein WAU68_04565 [Vitreimonas sp.]